MRKFIGLIGIALMVAGVSGCGGNADSLMKDQIKLMNEMADALESNAPQAKIEDLNKRGEALKEKLEALKLSDDEKKKLIEKHKDEFGEAAQRLSNAMMKQMGQNIGGFKMPGNDFKMP